MKISYLSTAAAVLALALTQTSGAGTLFLNGGITSGDTITGVTIDSTGNVTVTGTPAGGGGGGVTTTPPANCSLGASNLTPVAGGSSLLSVSCTSGSAPTSYTWVSSGGGPVIPVNSGNLYTVNFTTSGGPFVYSATASNSAGGPIATNTVSITVSPATGGNVVAGCPAVAVTNYNVLWNPQGGTPKQLFRIKKDEIAALKFTADNSGRNGYLTWVPNTSVSSKSVIVNISKCPGDFTQPSSPATYLCRAEGTENTLYYNQAASYTSASYACGIGTGDYYINIRNGARTSGSNKDPSYAITDSCPVGATCGVNVEFR